MGSARRVARRPLLGRPVLGAITFPAPVAMMWPSWPYGLPIPVEYLSDVQVAGYGRFVDDPSHADLQRFLRMDAATRRMALSKRWPQNTLGWAVQRGTARMLGTLLT